MLVIGVDVVVLAAIGLACTLLVAMFCIVARVSQEEGNAAVTASAVVAFVMLVGYVVMAYVLDRLMPCI